MTFLTGAKVLPDLIDEIADGLIGTPGGYWSDADTTWDTTDRTGDNARRALKYENGTEKIYIALKSINTDNIIVYYRYNHATDWDGRVAKGLQIIFSASWDSVNHEPAGSNMKGFVEFEAQRYAWNKSLQTQADLASLLITYYLWYDDSGFVITGKPEPHGNDDRQGSFLICIERNPNKEYQDGFTNFVCLNTTNYMNHTHNSNYPNRNVIRPFAFDWDSGRVDGWTTEWNGLRQPSLSGYYAFKSVGNGKVYYVKPIAYNSTDNKIPIFQLENCFLWTESVGLVDGDVVAVEGATTKYLCKALDSPDTLNRLPFAIKYVA